MDNKKRTTRGKFLSLLLRHQPGTIGLQLDGEGWASVPELLEKVAGRDAGFDRTALEEIVATNAKNRFEYDRLTDRIRARQGHSVEVDLGLEALAPPTLLFHGTADRFLPSIMAEGLRPGSRQHVHLSAEESTAWEVGRRHGRPVVLLVAAGDLVAAGQAFFRASNGVWLTGPVPAAFLRVQSSGPKTPA